MAESRMAIPFGASADVRQERDLHHDQLRRSVTRFGFQPARRVARSRTEESITLRSKQASPAEERFAAIVEGGVQFFDAPGWAGITDRADEIAIHDRWPTISLDN